MRILVSSLVLALFLTAANVNASGSCRISNKTGPVDAPLMLAVWYGDTHKVAELIRSGTDLNTQFQYCPHADSVLKTTPLLNAVWAVKSSFAGQGHEEMVEFLLRNGASPNLTVDGYSPLHMAVSFAELKVVQILLQYGAKLDARDHGQTPLHVAARHEESTSLAPVLIAAGADVNARDDLGNNAISLAAGNHNLDGVKLFLNLGVDPCVKDRDGRTALYWAELNSNEDPGKQEILSLLKTRCDD
jgi:ankyrin repeat protein